MDKRTLPQLYSHSASTVPQSQSQWLTVTIEMSELNDSQ